MTTPTSHLKPELLKVEADQTGNEKPHDYREMPGASYAFCLACSLVRQANGATDKKPCRGIVKIGLR
jgi:hypothetical protein